jgi:hypothetical protein
MPRRLKCSWFSKALLRQEHYPPASKRTIGHSAVIDNDARLRMHTNLFLTFSPESSVPLHIVAKDTDDAREIYTRWVIAHAVPWSHEPAVVREAAAGWLEQQPQLADAVAGAVRLTTSTVLYWTDHHRGWIAKAPEAMPESKIAPIEPLVRVYEVEDDGLDQLLVFAHDPTQAIQIYFDWREHWKKPHGPATIKPVSRWLLLGPQTVLREQMDIGYIGIAGWSPNEGWGIYPFDHELAGE